MTSTELSHLTVKTFGHADWKADAAPDVLRDAGPALENGDVVFLPHIRFEVSSRELQFFSPRIVGSSKNIGFDPATGKIGGSVLVDADQRTLTEMLARYSDQAAALVGRLVPRYRGRIAKGRASFRPVEIAGRQTSWRKDDTRLHIDAFPATPVHGRRILRAFTNVNPDRRPRTWRLGEPFEAIAGLFAPSLRVPLPGLASVLSWVRVTKSRRTPYDALMLQLHDRMKADDEYQVRCAQTAVDFPAGSTWIAFTDQVSHAAMSGQYQLEQTFLLPVDAMEDEQRSPLRVLERIKGRRLA